MPMASRTAATRMGRSTRCALIPAASIAVTSLCRINFDTVNIKPESFQTLEEVGLILARYNELRIEVGGHTDSFGSDTYNRQLSRIRGEAVLNWLLENVSELSLSQFTVVGYGESQPYATNDTEEGQTLNRRVEFKVLNTEELAKYRRIPPE